MKYLPLAECIRLNGERHLANAIGYASRGLESYSDGSLRKAVKNFDRADRLLFGCALPPQLQFIVDTLSETIANNIINGLSK